MSIQNQYPEPKNLIVIAMGDPAGIGIEVTLKALALIELPKQIQPLLVGCKKSISLIYKQLQAKGTHPLIDPEDFLIEDLPVPGTFTPGKASEITGEASFRWLTHATNLLMNMEARALVTAPIAKHAWHQAGHNYPGQTELLAEISGAQDVSMLFTAISPYTNWRLNTLLATTHIPLQKVPEALNRELIISKLDTLLAFCSKFKTYPKLAIAGLNPHSGEQGKIGTEEINWLVPTLNAWKKDHPNIELEGPIPPDSCWISSAQAWHDKTHQRSPDGILALYHDQGLIPVKLLAFDSAVNTTLGLPFLRTSPDHGTGFDIAGEGIARPESMVAALQTALDLTR